MSTSLNITTFRPVGDLESWLILLANVRRIHQYRLISRPVSVVNIFKEIFSLLCSKICLGSVMVLKFKSSLLH